MIKEYEIKEDNQTVKEYLKKIGFSRNLGKKVKLYGEIYINGEKAKNYFPLKKGDILKVVYEEKVSEDVEAAFSPLDICYEDDYFLVVNKDNNITVQPSKKYYTNNLLSYVKGYLKGLSNPHLINRLDYATSGLVIISKEGYIHSEFKKQEIEKKYLALVKGTFLSKEGVIDLPISRDDKSNIKRMVNENGQKAITKYKVIEEYNDKSLVELTLVTGRTHQIRVHLSFLNHPIIGDGLYGEKEDIMMLHAYYLKFNHFLTNEKIEVIKYPKWYKGDKLCQI